MKRRFHTSWKPFVVAFLFVLLGVSFQFLPIETELPTAVIKISPPELMAKTQPINICRPISTAVEIRGLQTFVIVVDARLAS